MTLARGATAFGAAIAVALSGSALVFVEVGNSPAPTAVLGEAQRFVRQRAVTSRAALTTTGPGPGDGSTLVRRQTVSGYARAGSADWTVTVGQAFIERREVAGRPGLWVRGAAAIGALATAKWAHAPDDAAVVAALAGPRDPAAAGTDRSTANLEARLASPTAVADLVGAASHPRRDGRDAHRLVVSLDRGGVAAWSGAPVDQATATLATDANGRPQRLVAEIRSGQAVVEVAYAVVWDRAGSVEPPSPDLVVAEL